MLRIRLRKFRELAMKVALDDIQGEKSFRPFVYLILQKMSRNYLAGGLAGYKYFYSRRIIVRFFDSSIARAFWRSNLKKQREKDMFLEIQRLSKPQSHFSKVLNRNHVVGLDKLGSLRILSLLPQGWARTKEEIGFPHAYHLLMTAKIANVNVIDFPTKVISANPRSHDREAKISEWQRVEKTIIQSSPNFLLVSGHKRSFDPVNKEVIENLKVKYDLKVLLLLLDDWSDEYVEMIEDWGNAVDKVLVYESNSVVSQSISSEKKLLWPFPRLVTINDITQTSTSHSLQIKFFGSTYLNRVAWLSFTKRICSKYQNISFEFNSGASAGQYSLNVGDYLDSYHQSRITIHFLERTPGVFTFTSSVWDAFAGGSLVIAQIGSNDDPISTFFRPGIDYLPFVTLNDLSSLIDKLSRSPDLAPQIASSGQRFLLANYNPRKMYSYLANQLL